MTSSQQQLATDAQQPDWPDREEVARVRNVLRRCSPLVTPEEIRQLGDLMARVAHGEALVLQAGDCAERFDESSPGIIRRRLGQLYGLAETMRCSTGLPVATIGRLAGQYGKPRSSPVEPGPSGEVPSYRGDAVNDLAADPRSRTPDPRRLLRAYHTAAGVLDTVRRSWHGRRPEERAFASHEFLLFDYEAPLVREYGHRRFATSAHLGWIGDRTRTETGPHVAFAAATANPRAVKLGPATSPHEAVALATALNPRRLPGALTFIVRMGAERIERVLPPVVAAVAALGNPVVWVSDPMHGNTQRTAAGPKTRAVDDMDREVAAFVRVLRQQSQWPGGLHLEMTPDDVTECVSGTPWRSTAPGMPRYRSACDPRLNPGQAAEVIGRFIALL